MNGILLQDGRTVRLPDAPEPDTLFVRLFVSTSSDSVSNTTTETAFAPTGVGSATIAAHSMRVGQVYRISVSGILSTI